MSTSRRSTSRTSSGPSCPAWRRTALCCRPGRRELGVRPFTIETTAGTWTSAVDDDAVRVRPGGGGHAAVRLNVDEITDIVHDLPDAD